MDPIETQKRAVTSHSLLKLSILWLFGYTFNQQAADEGYEYLMEKGYRDQAYVFKVGLYLFGACGALISQYLISYHKSCKSLISQGILFSLPVFMWNNFVMK